MMNMLIKPVRYDGSTMTNVRVVRTGKYNRCWRKYGMRPKYYGKSWIFADVVVTGGKQ